MRFLPISLLVGLLLQACSPATTKGMTERRPARATVQNPYFSRTDVDYLYKMNIQFGDHNFGGLLVVKKLDDRQHRVVLMGEMGNRYLDLTIGPRRTVKNFAMAELDKRLLIHVLGTDFGMMVDEEVPVIKEFTAEGSQVFLSRQGEGRRYLFFARPGGELQRIVRRGYGKERVELQFTGGNEGNASHITISHLTQPLTIDLDRIHN